MKNKAEIKYLLILLREQVIKQSPKKYWLFGERTLYNYFGGKSKEGLCNCCHGLHLEDNEYFKLKEYLYDNRPEETKTNIYFWTPGLVKPRLDWIDYHIQLNS